MAIGNGDLIYKCFPEHLWIGTARMKSETETDKDKRGASKERFKVGEKRSPDGLLQPSQNTKIINIIW